ncbi:MAG: hypothetical protein OEY74_03255 [Gammaproteobacteria bacterium]|nr:hypothetical protein [Gammaproteobacteria bacterium]
MNYALVYPVAAMVTELSGVGVPAAQSKNFLVFSRFGRYFPRHDVDGDE